jgi:MarR family transcriptional regulator, organic hydroperoxide resistance regulator
MNALDTCLRVSQAHAALQLRLDDELGTHHGFSWADFRLLDALARSEGDRLPLARLVDAMGLQASGVMRLLIPLEKTGQVQRESAGGQRWVVLRPAGRKQWHEAAETAQAACAELAARLRL